MIGLDQLKPLDSGAEEQLWCLFRNGPTWDGDLVTKCGRDQLYRRELIDRADGWQWLTRAGMMLALGLGMGERKSREGQR